MITASTKSLYVGLAINSLIEGIIPTYPIIADKGATYPFCVYRRTSFNENLTKDLKVSGYIETVGLELVIACTKYKESVELAQQIKDKLESTRNEIIEGVQVRTIEILNCQENWANDAYFQIMTLRIEIEK